MPGSISDSYDPEFGTGENAAKVSDAIRALVKKLNKPLGKKLLPILEVTESQNGEDLPISFCERELRIIRFCLNRALESI